MKITLTLNKRQLDVLLGTIESTFTVDLPGGQIRGLALLEAAAAEPSEYSYDIAMLAPAYTELVRHWKESSTDAGCAMPGDNQIRWGRRNRQRRAIERVLKTATEMAATT